jgi:hypothetical protein
MLKSSYWLRAWVVFWPLCAAGADPAPIPQIERVTARGDIHRVRAPQSGDTWLSLYQGNGRFGSCFGPWGLHPTPGAKPDYVLRGGSTFTHLKHWVRAKYNADYLLPVASIYWERPPEAVTDYEQHQTFCDGTIRTRFRGDGYRIEVLSWFDAAHRDVAGFRIEAAGDCPAIVFAPYAPAGKFPYKYGQQLEQSFTGRLDGDTWRGELRCMDRRTPLTIRSSAKLEGVPEGVKLTLKPGRNDILVTVGTDTAASAEDSLQATTAWWRALWQDSAWLDLPDEDAQKVWVRSLAYIHDSHNDDGTGDSPPNGLTGIGWPFPFPFDSGCRQPLLLWTGRIDAARAWLEYWSSQAEGLRAYTRRVWRVDGILLPHVFPYGPAGDFLSPEPPNRCYYPVYNDGHLVRIADQTAAMANDPEWTRRVALPLIEGAAQFYLAMARKGDDGLWHFSIKPSIGLDEHGGNDQPDYFCTLASAEYTFRRAIAHGLDTDGRMATILREGIAYKSLLSDQGTYYGNAGSGAKEYGHQKHPDQLAALVHLPMGHEPDAPTKRSYERRYDLIDPKKPAFEGHTGGEFILASTRMHDAAGWRKDWATARASRYVDPDWIQIDETSGRDLPFYVTTHGLFAQAILETVVSTWWDRLDLAACVPWPGTIRFGNIRTILGVTVSGEVTDGRGLAVLKAWKDTSFSCRGRTITLKRGEEIKVPIGP